MAGILNSKERMIDFIMTNEGKRQATSGQMKIEFVGFTDTHTFYEVSGSYNLDIDLSELASNRIYFEATNRYQDVIVPELEAGSSMRPFRTSDFVFEGKTIASGTFNVGWKPNATPINDDDIVNSAGTSLEGIANNFKDLRMLGTIDEFAATSGFRLTNISGSFDTWKNQPMGRSPFGVPVKLEACESMFADKRFAHFSNFLYLPPVNLPSKNNPKGKPLGKYPELGEKQILTFNDLTDHLKGKQMIEVGITETSRENNLLGQVFEYSPAGVEKLSIIDFGEFPDNDPISPGKRVFFIGKVLRDKNGAETFMNIFTAVFD